MNEQSGRPPPGRPAAENTPPPSDTSTLTVPRPDDTPLRRRREAARRLPPVRCVGGSDLADRDPLVPDGMDGWRDAHDRLWAHDPWLGTPWQRQRCGYLEPELLDAALTRVRLAARAAVEAGATLGDVLTAARAATSRPGRWPR